MSAAIDYAKPIILKSAFNFPYAVTLLKAAAWGSFE